MNPVRELRTTCGLTQQQLADFASTSQPTIAAYESGDKSPTWRTVERLAAAAGRVAQVQFFPALTREDRRSLALHAAIGERLREEPEAVIARARTVLRRMRMAQPGARALLDEWHALLSRPWTALLPVLAGLDPRARELRHVTPFAGVLSAAQRALVYREFARAERESAAGNAA